MLTTISIQKVKKNLSVFGYKEYFFLKDFEITELDSLETPLKKYRRKIVKVYTNRFFSCRIILAV